MKVKTVPFVEAQAALVNADIALRGFLPASKVNEPEVVKALRGAATTYANAAREARLAKAKEAEDDLLPLTPVKTEKVK
jgi:hypothetical protein